MFYLLSQADLFIEYRVFLFFIHGEFWYCNFCWNQWYSSSSFCSSVIWFCLHSQGIWWFCHPWFLVCFFRAFLCIENVSHLYCTVWCCLYNIRWILGKVYSQMYYINCYQILLQRIRWKVQLWYFLIFRMLGISLIVVYFFFVYSEKYTLKIIFW